MLHITFSRGDTNQNNEKTKRCSACHLVAYCSEVTVCIISSLFINHFQMCQKEHWYSNHQKMCKVLSGKKKKKCSLSKHRTGIDCKSSDEKSLSCMMKCILETERGLLLDYYWQKFGYHIDASCACTEEAKYKVRMESLAYPVQCPFTMGEKSGEYLGWVDENLAILLSYVRYIGCEMKAPSKSNMWTIMKYLLNLRATFWYLLTNEKKRYMSEVLLAVRLRIQVTDLDLIDKNKNSLESMDYEFSEPTKPKFQVWQKFLAHLAAFHRKLRWCYFQMFNVDLPSQKQEEFAEFKSLQVFALSHLDLPIFNSWYGLLSAGSRCCACEIDLSDKSAIWHLQSPMHQSLWLEQQSGVVTRDDHFNRVMLLRMSMPHIFEARLNLVSCGSMACNNTVYKMTLHYYESLARLTINWVFKTQQCNGCFQLCYETHRCSGCRSVRYCSKDCLLEDWRVHELSCKELAKEPEEEDTVNVRKLDGEKRRIFYERCISWLSKVDPVFHFFAHNWSEAKLGMDDIIVTPERKKKPRVCQNTTSKEAEDTSENNVLRSHEKKDSSTSELNKEESQEKKVEDINFSPVVAKCESHTCLGELRKKALDPFSVEMSVIGDKPVTFEETIRRQMTKDLAKRGLEIASMKSISLPMSSMTPENLAALGFGSDPGAIEDKRGTLMRIPKGLVKLPTTNEKKKKLTTADFQNFMQEATSKAVSIEEYDCRPKALAAESDSEDEGLAIIRQILENLPPEARARLDEITMRKRDSEEWSNEDYKELLMQLIPHLDGPQSRILSAVIQGKPRDDISIGSEVVNLIINVMAKNLVGKHFEIRDHSKLNSTLVKVEEVIRGTDEFYSLNIMMGLVGQEESSDIPVNYALSTCQLVDVSPQVASMVGQLCHMATKFKESNKLLDRAAISEGMEHAIHFLEAQAPRLHHWKKHRDMMYYLKGSSIEVRCMEFANQPGPNACDASEVCHVTASLKALRPACVGDNRVDFTR